MGGFLLGDSTTKVAPATSNDEAVIFIKRVLPEVAAGRFIGLHWFPNTDEAFKYAKEKHGKDKPVMMGRAYTTAEDAVSYARWTLNNAKGRNEYPNDFYICMSLCGMPSTRKSKAGNEYLVPTRVKNAARSIRTLFADFDVKPDAYADKAAVLADIAAKVAAGQLPQPTLLVDSGYGVHAHWVLDRELTPAEWESLAIPFAPYLKNTLGMHVDTNVTVDSVRVMRIPTMLNVKKRDNPVPTALIGPVDPNDIPVSVFETLLGSAVTQARPANNVVAFPGQKREVFALPAAFDTHTPHVAVPAAPEFSSGFDPDRHGEKPPIDFASVVAVCPTLSDIHARHGAGDAGMLWMMAILAASFAVEDERSKWAHEFSSGYAGYNYAETESKLQEKVNLRLQSGGRVGWPSCAAFARYSAKCQTCPFNGQGLSPFHHAKPLVPAVVAPADDGLPKGYWREDGAILTRAEAESGETTSVITLPYDVLDACIEERADGALFSATIVHKHNPETRIRLPIAAATAWRDEATKALGAAQIALQPEQLPIARRFFVSFIQHLQAQQENVVVRDPFGWVKTRDGRPGFAFDGRVFAPDGSEEPAAAQDEQFRTRFRSTGSLAAWKQASDLVMGMNRIDLQAGIATAFAAPLMRFSGENGVIVSLYQRKTGVQKSSALKVAQSVWGDPRTGMTRIDDTANAVAKKMGALRHLPIYWDELQTREQTANFAKLAFALTSGTEKARMGADTRLRQSGEWSTTLVCASNNSVRELLLMESVSGSAAGVARVLEFEVMPVALTTSAAQAAITLGLTHENFGLVGVEYAKMLVAMHDKLQPALATIAKSFEQQVASDTEQRFWIAAASTIYLGASLANRLLGGTVIQFPLPALHAFLCDKLRHQQETRKEDVVDLGTAEGVSSVVQGYIDHCRLSNACLETNTVPSGPGRPSKAIEMRMPAGDSLQRLRVPKAHIIHDDGKVRFIADAFREWVMKDRKLPFEAVKRDLEQYGAMTLERTRWAPGTSYAGAITKYYEIDTHFGRTPIGARIGHGR